VTEKLITANNLRSDADKVRHSQYPTIHIRDLVADTAEAVADLLEEMQKKEDYENWKRTANSANPYDAGIRRGR